MSESADTRMAPAAGGTSLSLRIAAIAVVLALASLAAYAVFSGPTRVPLSGPSKVAPAQTVPPEEGQEPEGDRGD